ncbi:alpha-L-fucosidase [Arthrobacter sp. 92]|uniref:alpha-L-fucosidase n=1 Tax=Arthrobacter sp. 92 TaxID=3418175 RepID=UPI003D0644ED
MADSTSTFPLRTIHLDFHTGPGIPEIGKEFDAAEFARRFKEAHVDSVTVFAKCHHGHLYYDTDRPERHPGLPRDLDLMGSQIDALHAEGIRAPIYLSVQCDEWAADNHPEWVALDEDLRQVKRGGSAYKAGWQILDMSSPYQGHLAEQIQEVLDKYAPVDGIFLDMCWDQPSSSRWAAEGMRRSGLDPRDPGQRAEYARAVSLKYMERFRDMIEPYLREDSAQGTWFNSRPKTRLHEESYLVRHVEIESLPTGGWGYAYLPYVARFVRPLGLPTLSHTGRFHKSWGDHGALKPEAALLYECAQILSLGLTGGVGDLLHPNGMPNPVVYERIGKVYDHIERCEPFVLGGTLKSEIALIVDPELGDAPGPSGIGAVRALQQLRQQFDIIGPDADLSPYRLVLIPESTRVRFALQEKLSAFLGSGGGLIIAGEAAVDDAGNPVLNELGIEPQGPSPFSHVFLRAKGSLEKVTDPFDTVIYERTQRMRAANGGEVLCSIVEPYFERSYDQFSGHDYTVPEAESSYAAIIRNGSAVTLAAPLLKAFGAHANAPYRELLGGVIDLLLPDPLLRDDGPAHLEATVVERGGTTAVHLLSFIPARLAEGLDVVHDAVPVSDLNLRVKRASAPQSVTLQPEGRPLEFSHREGYVHTTLSFSQGHSMVVIQ